MLVALQSIAHVYMKEYAQQIAFVLCVHFFLTNRMANEMKNRVFVRARTKACIKSKYLFLLQMRLLAHVFRSQSPKFRTKTGNATGRIIFCMDPTFCCIIGIFELENIERGWNFERECDGVVERGFVGIQNVYCAYYIVYMRRFIR
jgi:hypothetical protein